MAIYNRNGQEVYRAADAHAGWDGTFNGQPCDAGTYYYQVELLYPDGKVKRFKGDLLLLR